MRSDTDAAPAAPIALSLLTSARDTDPIPAAVDWLDVLAPHALRDKKDGPAFVPAVFTPGGRRRTVDIEALTCAVYDVDEGAIDVAAVAARLEASGIEHLIHSSHSHRASKPALRVILPLARPVPAFVWADAWKRGARLVGPGVSSKSKDVAHLYYLPSCPADHAGEAVRIYRPGQRLDLLADVPAAPLLTLVRRPPEATADAPPVKPWTREAIFAAAGSFADAEIVYEGKPFAPGGRDDRTHKAVSAVVFATDATADEESVLAFFRPTIEAMRAAAPHDPIPLTKVSGSYRRAVVRFVAEQARDAEIRSVVGKACAASRAAGLDTTPYCAAELKTIAGLAGCTVAELPRRWAIQHGDSFYLLGPAGYGPPLPFRTLTAEIPRALSRMPDAADVTPYYLQAQSCTVAHKSCASLLEPHTRYDDATRTIHEAAAPLRSLTPYFDPQIDAWLRLLGGDKADKADEAGKADKADKADKAEALLDWIATVAELARPTAALFVVGPPSCGKSMLAEGLARLWVDEGGGPTDAAQVLGSDFNSALAACPLILADEGLPGGKPGQKLSQQIRTVISADNRPLKRKYLADTTLRGCVRLIVTANNDRVLEEMMKGEDRDSDSISALALRFLVIRCGKEAADFLAGLGGRAGTGAWVDGDGIARHALHLRDERAAAVRARGGRFLVEGEVGASRDALAVGDATAGLVVEWIVRTIMARPPGLFGNTAANEAGGNGKHEGFLVGGGRILAQASAIVDQFHAQIGPDHRTPTARAVGRALTTLRDGTKPVRVGNRDFHAIRHGPVIKAAIDGGFATAEEMQAKINAPAK